uniref:Transcription termination/antitermination protein NusA n=1 Tax=candidate division WOR-3 bacterium TaxID=2052148 RepID=A0A7C4YHW0_UNCW3
MIKKEVVEMLTELAREKGFDKQFVVSALKDSILKVAEMKFNKKEGIICEISESTGEVKIYLQKKIVKNKDDVKNDIEEISYEEALTINPEAKVGDTIYVPYPVSDIFGRYTINQIKNNLIQRFKETEREILFKKYQTKIGELVSGVVTNIYAVGCYVKLTDVEAFLDKEDMIPNDIIKKGKTIRAIVKKVEEKPSDREKVKIKGPVIYLTRTSPKFVAKLLEFEIPEILKNEVEIKKIVRIPGVRCKIAVYSKNEKIDPLGACVGPRGTRIQGISKELGKEKIDIIPWSEDPVVFIGRSLSLAKVLKVIIKKPGNKAICVVPDDQITTAIGQDNSNIQLANEITGYDIQIVSQSEYYKEAEETKRKKLKVEELELNEKTIEILKKHGFKTAKEIMASSTEEIAKITGLKKKTIDKIYKEIHDKINLGE